MERKVNISEICNQFYYYVLSEHRSDLLHILEDASSSTKHFPVYVNFLTLSESCALVADLLRSNGSQVLPALDQALTRAARLLHAEYADQPHTAALTLKPHLHARLIELPICAELHRTCVPRIEDEAQLLCVAGTVVRTGLPHLLETSATYCCNKCRHRFTVNADYAQTYQAERPMRCANPQRCRGGAGFSVVSANEEADARTSRARDYQEIRLQEQVQKLDVGKIPRGLCVVLEDDLVDSCKSGDDVIITGTVRQRWRSAVRGCRPDIEMTLHANRVFVNNERRGGLLLTEARRATFARFWRRHRHAPLHGRNAILRSFCSQIYGMYVVKLAVALTLVGGVRKVSGTSSVRGEPHLLLIGDPGTGKSQLLKYAARLCPRSVLTTGTGSTSAGLTCAAVKEGPEWQLEAGALVLADGGVCCIDEFNSIREADKTSIHEAMEQQTISVAKAGMVCKLNTRCSIVAAANPKRAVDWCASADQVFDQLGLGTPLISRFDLILVLKDARSEAWDKLVSSYILAGLDPLKAHGSVGGASGGDHWDLETLQAYLAHVRTLQPEPDAGAVTLLQTYYQRVRAAECAGACRTTVRLLESLLRLTQAHARLRCSRQATLCDAVMAVTLMEASLGGLGGGLLGPDGVGHILHTAFPDDPRLEYQQQCELILGRLGLDSLLTEELAALEASARLTTEHDDSSSDGGDDGEDRHPSLYVEVGVKRGSKEVSHPSTSHSRSPHSTPQTGQSAAATASAAQQSESVANDDRKAHSPIHATDASTCERTDGSAWLAQKAGGVESLASRLSKRKVNAGANVVATVNMCPAGEDSPGSSNTFVSRPPEFSPGLQTAADDEVGQTCDAGGVVESHALLRLGNSSEVRKVDNAAFNGVGEMPGGPNNDYTHYVNETVPSSSIAGDTLTRLRSVSPSSCFISGCPAVGDGISRVDTERLVISDLKRFKFVKPTKKVTSCENVYVTSDAKHDDGAVGLHSSLDSLMLDLEGDEFESSLRDKTNHTVPNIKSKRSSISKKVMKVPNNRACVSNGDDGNDKFPENESRLDANRLSGLCANPARYTAVTTTTTRPIYTPLSACRGTSEKDASIGRKLSAATRNKLARFSAEAQGGDSSQAHSSLPMGKGRSPEGSVSEKSVVVDSVGGFSAGHFFSDMEDDLDLDFEWPSAKRVKS